MYKNNSNVICTIKGLNFIINTENGAVVGVNESFLKDYEMLNEHDIKNNHDFYNFLLENEFIFLDKPKKKERHVASAYLHVTNNCNLNCLGCYSKNDDRNKAVDLSTDQLKHILDELKKVKLTNLVISGGEPLLRQDIVELMRYAKEECHIKQLVIITNGTIDKPGIFKNLSKYVDTISVSMDTYCSSCPPFLRDEGIFDKIMQSIVHMKDCGLNVAILPTLHHKNISNIKDYMTLAENLKTKISFSIFTTNNSNIYNGYHIDNNNLEFLAKYFSSYGLNVEDFPMKDTLEGKNRCGAGCSLLSVATNGDLYPCHMLMYKQFKMGSLLKQDIIKILDENEQRGALCSNLIVDNIKGCNECEYKYICGGGCRGRAFLKMGDIKAVDPFCTMFKGYYDNMLDNIKKNIRT